MKRRSTVVALGDFMGPEVSISLAPNPLLIGSGAFILESPFELDVKRLNALRYAFALIICSSTESSVSVFPLLTVTLSDTLSLSRLDRCREAA